MDKKAKLILTAVAALLLSACATGVPDFSVATDRSEIDPTPADKAQIVFLRVSFFGGAIPADIFEIENGDLNYVGKLRVGRKLVHLTAPGKKVYMGHGLAADFMLAEVEAGKRYYVLLRPNWGTGAFVPTPIKRNGTTNYHTAKAEFSKWLEKTKVTEMKSDEADAWLAANQEKFQQIYETYWAKFETKSAEQKRIRTLMPADGK